MAATQYTVDLWWTDLNDVEFGLFRQSRHRAKSRQFTADSDVIGEVKANGERTGLLSYREGLWKTENPVDRRLVIKLFSPSMTWRGTMDLLIGRSLQLSFGAGGFPVTAFSINVSGHEQIIDVERSARKWPLMPEKFSFFILEDNKPRFYRLRRDWIEFGADYTLYDQTGARIGHLNGRVIDIGGRWDVGIDKAHDTPRLNTVLQLFCGMLRYNRRAKQHVEQLARQLRNGAAPALDAHEIDLYLNPRRPR
jgi:hypothetical protein